MINQVHERVAKPPKDVTSKELDVELATELVHLEHDILGIVGDDHDVKVLEEVLLLGFQVLLVSCDLDHWVPLSQAFQRCCCAILANLIGRRQERRNVILLGQLLMIEDGHAVDPGQDEVLGDLITQASDSCQQHSARSQPLLSVQSPKSNLEKEK